MRSGAGAALRSPTDEAARSRCAPLAEQIGARAMVPAIGVAAKAVTTLAMSGPSAEPQPDSARIRPTLIRRVTSSPKVEWPERSLGLSRRHPQPSADRSADSVVWCPSTIPPHTSGNVIPLTASSLLAIGCSSSRCSGIFWVTASTYSCKPTTAAGRFSTRDVAVGHAKARRTTHTSPAPPSPRVRSRSPQETHDAFVVAVESLLSGVLAAPAGGLPRTGDHGPSLTAGPDRCTGALLRERRSEPACPAAEAAPPARRRSRRAGTRTTTGVHPGRVTARRRQLFKPVERAPEGANRQGISG